jgi:hypothetical protein
MIIDSNSDSTVSDLELTETELFINRLFVQGDYKQYADKFKIDREDLKRILHEASLFLNKNNIQGTIALILKPVAELREAFIACTGTSNAYIINSNLIKIINDTQTISDILTQPVSGKKSRIFSVKLDNNDNIILCSANLSNVLDNDFIQRTVITSNGPEEACKKLLHSASLAAKKDNISIASYNSKGTKRPPVKNKVSTKTILIIIIPLFLILIGIVIYRLSSGTTEYINTNSPVNTPKPSKQPPVIQTPEIEKKNNFQPSNTETQTPSDQDVIKKSPDKIKKIDIDFIVNGSVVMISNWESIRQDILYIKWDNGITDKKRIHKYASYTDIPSSIKVTYKDYTTKNYSIK